MKSNDTLIHVELANGEHHYFGSITAVFDTLSHEQLGISRQTLYTFDIDHDRPYINRKCTIRKGKVKRKAGQRKPPVKVLRVN